ncbi:MAG: 3-deoxy-8-phosphooctulonate synthase [Bacteriovoracaceae bacterium]|nr:3-deoxy-8-phosphooctulonate synthase [Bacteriovoracaceae bacterium]
MKKIDFIIGPCVLENEALVLNIAERLKDDLGPFSDKINLTFKGSFDKANRTSIDSFRGPGIDKGLAMLARVKKDFELSVLTDFHLPSQASSVAEVVDILQVPAFLCRQTDMIVEGSKACKTHDRVLNIKKGQFLSPMECEHIVKKAQTILPNDKICITERGTSFGYNNLIVDMSSFQILNSFGVKSIFDATHAVQRPGGQGTTSGGKREQVACLAKAAVAAGAQGIFLETHPNPEQALSDSATSLPLFQVKDLVKQLIDIYTVISTH